MLRIYSYASHTQLMLIDLKNRKVSTQMEATFKRGST